MRPSRGVLGVFCLLSLFVGGTAGSSALAAPATATAAAKSIPDAVLLDQNGKTLHFYRDKVAGRLVAIQFIFTSCRLTCPLLGVQFGKLQKLLGERLGHEVGLLSLSVDPLTDRPEELAAWAQKFHAQPGWDQLTGERSEVEKLLRALGAYTADKTQHTSFLLLIDDRSGQWQRLDGLSPAAAIAEQIETMLAAE